MAYVALMVTYTIYAYVDANFYVLNNPTQFFLILAIGAALLIYPKPGTIRKRTASVMIVAAVCVIIFGSAVDLKERIGLADRVSEASKLFFHYFEDPPISDAERGNLIEKIRNEPIRIDLLQTLTNYFFGYNICMCGSGHRLIDEANDTIFSVKHGHEMYINGYVCFKTTIQLLDYLEREETEQSGPRD